MSPSPARWGRWVPACLLALACCAAGAAAAQSAFASAPASSPAAAGPAARLPPEAFFKHPDVLQAQLSPSGRRLAITTARGAQRVGLLVIELEPALKVARVALFNDADIVGVDWVGDDRLLFSVSELELGGGEARYSAPGLYGIDADGGNLRQLVQRRPVGVVVPTLSRQALSYNHVLLKVPEPGSGAPPDEVVIGNLVFSNTGELTTVVPRWLNVRNGSTRALDVTVPSGAGSWLFDSAGQPRVVVARVGDRLSVLWRGPGDTAWTSLADGTRLRLPFWPRFVDDNRDLVVSHSRGAQGYSVLSRYDFARRAVASEPWVSSPGFDVRGEVVPGRPGSGPIGVRVETDAETTVWFDAEMKRLQADADARWPDHVNRLRCRRCGAPDMVVLAQSWSDRDPGQLWLYRAASRQWQPVSKVLDGIDPATMARVDFQRIQARDGRDLPVWLTVPPGRQAGQPGPAVVLVHGGPWVRGGHWRWNAMEQFLASRGYLVISPEFRGSSGYGQAHERAGYKQWGQAMQDDVADALLWAQKQGLVDQRVCIAGASYGGYATLMGLIRHPDLYRCGVAWVAVTDPFLLLEGAFWVRDDTSDIQRQVSLPERVGDAKADAEMLTATSPVAQAARIRAPLLLAFGESDLRVPLAHGTRLRDALRKAGRDPLWVTYPDEGHGWRSEKNQVDFARRVEKFLADSLRDVPAK